MFWGWIHLFVLPHLHWVSVSSDTFLLFLQSFFFTLDIFTSVLFPLSLFSISHVVVTHSCHLLLQFNEKLRVLGLMQQISKNNHVKMRLCRAMSRDRDCAALLQSGLVVCMFSVIILLHCPKTGGLFLHFSPNMNVKTLKHLKSESYIN